MYAHHHPSPPPLPPAPNRPPIHSSKSAAPSAHSRHSRATKLLTLGETHSRTGKRWRFGLLPEDRLRHVWIVGKTGIGKSTLLANLLTQDVARGVGAALLDPHGSLVQAMLAQIPPHRLGDVWLFRPADPRLRLPFNIFKHQADRALLTSQLISVFRKQWHEFWGPRTEHILRHAILATSCHPNASLSLLYRFVVEEGMRQEVLTYVEDDMVRTFWCKEWPSYSKRLQSEALAPLLNKLGAFLGSPVIRQIVGHPSSLLDIKSIIERQEVLLVDLSIGKIGEDTASLLGGLVLSAIELAAQTRDTSRPPFFVYADEFHRFASDSLRTTLAESRKFGLGLVLAHQYTDQLSKSLLASLLGNIGTTIAFRLGPTDARRLEAVFEPPFDIRALMELPAFHMAVRQLARGQQLPAFGARSLPAPPASTNPADTVSSIAARMRRCWEALQPAPTPPSSCSTAPSSPALTDAPDTFALP